jgi:hypothetical protein
LPFGAIHGGVGKGNQVGAGRGVVMKQRDADAQADHQVQRIDPDRGRRGDARLSLGRSPLVSSWHSCWRAARHGGAQLAPSLAHQSTKP